MCKKCNPVLHDIQSSRRWNAVVGMRFLTTTYFFGHDISAICSVCTTKSGNGRNCGDSLYRSCDVCGAYVKSGFSAVFDHSLIKNSLALGSEKFSLKSPCNSTWNFGCHLHVRPIYYFECTH
jgi:hypothetical protein